MRRAGLLLASLGLVADAAASPCGSDSSSDSDSSSSDSSSSDSDSSSSDYDSTPATPACIEHSDVVGYRECTPYGKWASRAKGAPVFVEIGMAHRQFRSPLSAETGTITHGAESFSYRMVGPRPEAKPAFETAAVVTARVGTGLGSGFFLAVEAELGGVLSPQATPEMTSEGVFGTPEVESTQVVALNGLGVFGFQHRLGPITLGGEAAAGVGSLHYQVHSSYHNCETDESIAVVTGLVEGRARASYAITPYFTLGATYGKSLIDDAWMAGVSLGWHNRAFGGL
jgi:hypothetical protein